MMDSQPPVDADAEPFRVRPADRVSRLPPYLFARINALLYRKRRAGDDVIDLGMGNPSDPPQEQVIEKLAEAARDPANHGYSQSRGILNLRREVAAPEDAPVGAAKSAAAQAATALRPIARKEAKLKPVAIAAGACGALAVLVIAWVAGQQIQELPVLRVIGLLIISPPIAAAGYMFLRNDELEPYRGQALWIRASICAAVYILLWVGYYFIPSEITGVYYAWFFLPIPFAVLGALAPFAALDLEFGNAFFHYAFYVGVTLVLGMLAGLHMPWQGVVV